MSRMDRANKLKSDLANPYLSSSFQGPLTPEQEKERAKALKNIASQMESMDASELQEIIPTKDLVDSKDGKKGNYELAASLPSSYYKSLEKKVEKGEMTQADYNEVLKSRDKGFIDSYDGDKKPSSQISSAFRKLDTDDLVELHEKSIADGKPSILTQKHAIAELSTDKLKKLVGKLDEEARPIIGQAVRNAAQNHTTNPSGGWHAPGVKAINDNPTEWGL